MHHRVRQRLPVRKDGTDAVRQRDPCDGEGGAVSQGAFPEIWKEVLQGRRGEGRHHGGQGLGRGRKAADHGGGGEGAFHGRTPESGGHPGGGPAVLGLWEGERAAPGILQPEAGAEV